MKIVGFEEGKMRSPRRMSGTLEIGLGDSGSGEYEFDALVIFGLSDESLADGIIVVGGGLGVGILGATDGNDVADGDFFAVGMLGRAVNDATEI